jgi:general secretion pathway protein G
MSYLRDLRLKELERGEAVTAIKVSDRRVRRYASTFVLSLQSKQPRGFTLIELVITITILTILTMGVVPLLKVSVKRRKEQQLQDILRQMRGAIDEFHRDTVNMNCSGTAAPPPGAPQPGASYVDPRSKVMISDCTIFGVDNPDRYPPDIETLVSGVNVVARGGLGGGRGDPNVKATDVGGELATKKKVYLRGIPVDPITGKAEWDFLSCYDAPDSGSWGGENIFDVRSKSKDTALNGEKYSDW